MFYWSVALLACAAVTLVVLRSRPGGHPMPNSSALEHAGKPLPESLRPDADAVAWSAMAGVPMEPIGARSEVRDRLGHCSLRGTCTPDDRQLQMLYDLCADFVFLRFGQPSAQTYVDWRKQRGDVLIELDELLKTYTLAEAWKAYFDERLPADMPTEELFRRVWPRGLDWSAGYNRPVSMAAAAPGLAVVTDCSERFRGFPDIDGELGKEAWKGSAMMALRPWWTRPRQEIGDAAFYSPLRASVGIMFECADGNRRAFAIHAAWVHDRSDWELVGVVALNSKYLDRTTALEY